MDKREQLARLLRERLARTRTFPLALPQERFWFFEQLTSGSALYHMPAIVRLRGSLDVVSLERSVEALVQRHESLRTTFAVENGSPVQRVAPAASKDFSLQDLTAIPPADREHEALQRGAQSCLAPFDFANGPLFRAKLIRTADDEHYLALAFHHIIADGWSLGVFVRELAQLYRAMRSNAPVNLPRLPIQYADFAEWQRKTITEDQLDGSLRYWTERLKNVPPLEFPLDRRRPAKPTFRGDRESVRLPLSLMSEARDLGKATGTTAYLVALTAFQVLLSRFADQDEFVVGTPIAGRSRPELDNVFGCFVNTLALRADLSGDPTFVQLLERTRLCAFDAYPHQDLPLERVVDRLASPGASGRHPLFSVMFSHNVAPASSLGLDDLQIELIDIPTGLAKFDIVLSLTEMPNGVRGFLEYSTDVLNRDTANRLAEGYHRILQAVCRNPDQHVSRIPLITDNERVILTQTWNRDVREFPANASIAELFVKQTRKSPDTTAVVDGDRAWTYQQLDQFSDRIAAGLIERGIRPHDCVAISVDRSAEMIGALLGILKAGATYVPLDTVYPAERIRVMLQVSQTKLLLTRRASASRVDSTIPSAFIEDLGSGPPRSERSFPTRGEDIAVIFFTSGSTGSPKGVEVTHRGLARLTCNTDFHCEPGERFLHGSSISFDAASLEIWLPLLNGATVVICPRETMLAPEQLRSLIERENVSSLLLTTALFHQFVRDNMASLLNARRLFFGGEACDPVLAFEFTQRFPTVEVINLYGPTECTTISSYYSVQGLAEDAATVPIGKPVPNSTLYVLDRNREPCPIGFPGELYVGGPGVARGYRNDVGRTDERFVADPFERRETRIYRTGDRVRWKSEGILEYLGRLDAQVKIRGFRIELGDIESCLRSHPDVADAVVDARPSGDGLRRLAAYIVPRGRSDNDILTAVRSHLIGRLPLFMIPESLQLIDAIPTTTGGKVDRRALPEPTFVGRLPGRSPVGATEQGIVDVFREVLAVSDVGADEDFFSLGGHSLKAMQVVVRLRERLGREVPLRMLFENSTAERLALAVASLGDGRDFQTRIEPADRASPLPLSYSQERLWLLHQIEPESPYYNIPSVVQLSGRLDVEAFGRAMTALVARHEILRTVYDFAGTDPCQKILPPQSVDTPVEDLAGITGDERRSMVRRVAEDEARRPFDLSTGPIFRCRLLRFAEADHVCVMTIHHIAADGWSMGVMVRELGEFYSAMVDRRPALLPPMAIQYADFAAWQRRYVGDEVIAKQLAYWEQHLQGAPQILELPADFPRPERPRYRGEQLFFELPPSLTGKLKRLGEQHGATLFMTILAAFQAFLSRLTRQEDICVGTPVAGRNHNQIEGLIGFFVNTLVMRATTFGDPTFAEFLNRVRDNSLAAFSHADVPFEQLVARLSPHRMINRSPLFQALFALQNMPLPTMKLAGVELTPWDVTTGTSKVDLSLVMAEESGRLRGCWTYDTDLFARVTVQRWSEHFRTLLESIVEEPNKPLSLQTLLTPTESKAIVELSSGPCQPARTDCGTHVLIEEQVDRTPHAIAVVAEGRSCSYRELDIEANRLGHFLRGLGVDSEHRVGLCLPRSIDLIVAMLGTWKAGGAFVPIDPRYPRSRIECMVHDSGLSVIITTSHVVDQIPSCNAKVICLGRNRELISACPESRPVTGQDGRNLAYVIFTSGSTGRPKGVGIEHRSLCNFATVLPRLVGLSGSDRVAQFSSPSFDASLHDIVPTLCIGGSLHLCEPDLVEALTNLPEKLRAEQLTTMTLTPSALAAVPESNLPALQLVMCGGEVLPLELARRWRQGRRFFNVYGPTEAAITSHLGEVERDDVPPDIGFPLPNTCALVLDPQMQPCPIGVPGELYLGGINVARGYINDPTRTAERFVPNPFAGEGARLYRTGDLVRLRADGRYEYLGRVDNQLKIRGNRIEPGEIEATLRMYDEVSDAVVVGRPGPSGDVTLVAYVVAAPGTKQASFTRNLQQFLADRLPAAMIPEAIVLMASFPLAPGGKLDRSALPAPLPSPSEAAAKRQPETELEKAIAAAFAEVLGISDVGADDDFFRLGGQSLKAVQLAAKLRKSLEREFPLRLLFQFPTPAQLAIELQSKNNDDGHASPSLLRSDANLPRDLTFSESPARAIGEIRKAFLTGATGFLGAHLLADLMSQTTWEVHCLVRARDAVEGLAKIQRTLERYRIWRSEWTSRIVAIAGDLSQPFLGLSESAFCELGDRVDTIYHCGAEVNFIHPYDKLKAANVSGTLEVLRLAGTGHAKSLHYVSTLSVFSGRPSGTELAEDDPLDADPPPRGGYAQSKWVAERLVQAARDRGLKVTIYRPGRITGHSRHGLAPSGDLVHCALAASSRLKALPDVPMDIEMTPVDVMSRVITRISLEPELHGTCYHVYNPAPLTIADLREGMRAAGIEARTVPLLQWAEMLRDLAAQPGESDAATVAAMLPTMGGLRGGMMPRFAQGNLWRALDRLHEEFPKVDRNIIETYIRVQ